MTWKRSDFWATYTFDVDNPYNSFDVLTKKVSGYTAKLSDRDVGVYIDDDDKLWLVDVLTGAHIDISKLMHAKMRPSEWLEINAEKVSEYITKYTSGWWYEHNLIGIPIDMIKDAYAGLIDDDGYYKGDHPDCVPEYTGPEWRTIPYQLQTQARP